MRDIYIPMLRLRGVPHQLEMGGVPHQLELRGVPHRAVSFEGGPPYACVNLRGVPRFLRGVPPKLISDRSLIAQKFDRLIVCN